MTEYDYDQKIITLALVKYAGVNPRSFDLLLRSLGSLNNILAAEESELAAIMGISGDSAHKVSRAPESLKTAAKESAELAQKKIALTTRFDNDYPSHLFEINDPPPLFYSRGNIPDINEKSVALMGAIRASQEGIALTTKLVKELVARKVQLISSLDVGIASAVHLSTKAGGGKSYAIIDCGLDRIEGDGAIPMAIDLIQTGGVISEYDPDRTFEQKKFAESNRLIAGMSQAVIVTEFYEDSNRVHDILEYCHQIGKLCFILTDTEFGLLSDEKSLAQAVKHGAILMNGLEKIDDIVKVLV